MLMFIYWGFPSFMFLLGVMVFVLNCKHLLVMLLSLEAMVLSLFTIMVIYLSLFSYEMFFSMLYLAFCVCEGALGLSILVSMIRTHGNDYFSTFNVLQC
uniref:NADH dehydrogenase subunit 4L n=1 Tax=Tipula legalis TaxID=3116508 RepID=UPI003002EF01|nr:NADH dehydrogenase subunit 4L [Tipula legalis]